jgi:prepilin signal peptidase PulO-like enzyme (type II secretory pathway)
VPPVAAIVSAYLVVAAMLYGSFINLAADRLPRGESILWPRSHCRSCGRNLNLIDLVPIAGYAIRGGRCASCRTAIGVSSPIVEAVAGILMMAAVARLGMWPGVVAGFGLVALWGAGVVGVTLRVNLGRVQRVAPGVTLADDAGADQLAQRTF